MAIVVFSNQLLKNPEIWEMLEDYAEIQDIVKQDTIGTVMRIQNEQLPKEDYLVDLTVYRFLDIRPFVISFKVLSMYTHD